MDLSQGLGLLVPLFSFLLLLVSILVGLGFLISVSNNGVKSKSASIAGKYTYGPKRFFLTRPEHEFYDALVSAAGNEYLIFAQVHLPTIVDFKIPGQNWKGALSHISRKSVDFVLCDRAYISPKLAIELDDSTHDRPERMERDSIVEGILAEAGLPLLRVRNHGYASPAELSARIQEALAKRPDRVVE